MQDVEVAPVTLTGRGHVQSESEAYVPGDYYSLQNMIITPEGTLKKRLPAHGFFHNNTIKLNKIVGSWGPNVMYASYNEATGEPLIYQSLNDTQIVPCNLLNMVPFKAALVTASGFSVGTNFLLVEGFVQYGEVQYAIVLHSNVQYDVFNPNSARYTQKYYSVRVDGYSNSQATAQAFMTFDSAPSSLVPFATFFVDHNTFSHRAVPTNPVAGYKIFKERFFIAVGDTVYFSKGTDPAKFATVDDGGFFKFPGKVIKSFEAIGDNIYVIFENSISVINYSTSPNVDAKVTVISEGVGGKSSCVYTGSVYVLDHFNIHVIQGNNVSKLIELNVPLTSTNKVTYPVSYNDLSNGKVIGLHMEAFADALYVTKRWVKFASNGSIYYTKYEGSGEVYRVDLKDGNTSKHVYKQNAVTHLPADLAVVSFGFGIEESSRLHVMCASSAANSYSGFHHSLFDGFMIGPAYGNVLDILEHGLDSFSNAAGTSLLISPIEVDLELRGFSPDQLFYKQKKWRSVQVQANLPVITLNSTVDAVPVWAGELELTLFAHNKFIQALSSAHLLSEVLYANSPAVGVNGYKYGINQRTPSLGMRIKTRSDYTPKDYTQFALAQGLDYIKASQCEIVELSLLWSHIKSLSNNGLRFSQPK